MGTGAAGPAPQGPRSSAGQRPAAPHPLCSAAGASRDEWAERGEGGAGGRQRGIRHEGECPMGCARRGGGIQARGSGLRAWVSELNPGWLLSGLDM